MLTNSVTKWSASVPFLSFPSVRKSSPNPSPLEVEYFRLLFVVVVLVVVAGPPWSQSATEETTHVVVVVVVVVVAVVEVAHRAQGKSGFGQRTPR